MSETITLSAIVAASKIALKIESSDQDVFFEYLANEAVRHLDSLSVFTKQLCTIDIIDSISSVNSLTSIFNNCTGIIHTGLLDFSYPNNVPALPQDNLVTIFNNCSKGIAELLFNDFIGFE